ncbi:MAG: beta-propeller domain-containing protein [Ruminococcus sp.]|nr:beta-propeller domain-containing protein [Ruminococcus sp.]
MNKNDEKVKKFLEKEDIPEELTPENIRKMLDEKAPTKKRNNISVAGRVGALVASLAVIAGGTLAYTSTEKKHNCIDSKNYWSMPETSRNAIAPETDTDIQQLTNTGNYMTGAEDYEQIYTLFKEVADNRKQITQSARTYGAMDNGIMVDGAIAEGAMVLNEDIEEEVMEDSAVYDYDYDDMETVQGVEYEDAMKTADIATSDESAPLETGAGEEFSETYNQEENVLEADIVKTDGKNIYYACNDYSKESTALVNYATVDKGTFTGYGTIDIADAVNGCFGAEYNAGDCYVQDMYLYNDMLIVLGTVNGYTDDYYDYKNSCFVSFYTTDETPQLIDTYYQEGYYNDVRISPEGYMYLISNYSSWDFYRIDTYEDIERYIPTCGVSDNIECIPAGDILLPEDAFEDMYNLSYSVIGSLDLTQSGTFAQVDTKALAGYTGEIYCSGGNMYTTSGWDETDITRISINGGTITPEASGTVSGRVNDQFSMSEYNGYFRIAVTNDEYEEKYHSYYDDETVFDRVKDKITGEESGYYSHELVKRDNRVYVLDMDLNIVGSIEDFGIDETIKSVKFSGDMAYVVTYEQTDPLFAIDLSDPTNPTILDEFKILGYSTYMQEWNDGLLLGFGVNADENGIETGIKLTMFDNSDPYNLNAVATYTLDREGDEWLYSSAVWERKALMIAPEKNLIGIPVIIEKYNYYDVDIETEFNNIAKYMFFSYDDGEFTLKGEISTAENNAWIEGFDRAVYIGDYVYALSGDKFISADIETITECDKVYFDNATEYQSLVVEPETKEETTESATEEIIEHETEESTKQENSQVVMGCKILEVNDSSILCCELNTENEYIVSLKDVADSEDVKNLNVGDSVIITFDGNIAESYPMQINTVYKIEILTITE